MSDEKTISPKTQVVRIGEHDITLRPIRLNQFFEAVEIVAPIAELIQDAKLVSVTKTEDGKRETKLAPDFPMRLAKLVMKTGSSLMNLISVFADIDVQAVEKLELDDAIKLAAAAFEVNLDFFTETVLPALTTALGV